MRKLLYLATLLLISFHLPAFAGYEEDSAKAIYDAGLPEGCDKVIIKDAKLAATLSLLPGGGSFYTGSYGLGIVDLLLWPFSVIWEIPTSAAKAHERNQLASGVCKVLAA